MKNFTYGDDGMSREQIQREQVEYQQERSKRSRMWRVSSDMKLWYDYEPVPVGGPNMGGHR